ncbi:MAG: TonB-dependent receptor [Bryobacterales bacterium]|nr:TonB-dependent receptor [Bryobacterales bacterium]
MTRQFFLIATVLACLTVAGASAQQADTAVVVGVVTDATGAVIPGVDIRFSHTSTGAIYTAQTDPGGYYRTPPLRIGDYLMQAESAGFKRIQRTGIILNAGDTRQVDLTLEIGEVTETIEVVAQAPLLQTQEGATGTVMENQQILELPLNGRDYLQLARISAGVTPPARSEVANRQGISVGGSQATQVNFIIDGIDNNNQSIASQGGQKEAIKPQLDAVQEFKILTNAYSAEFGRSMGGVVTMTTKSGTNDLHGSVFEFLRNERMDARNFFVPHGSDKPPFARDQYGFSVGGPLKRNRAFLFGDMELTDIRESSTRVNTIPNLMERAGDFSGGDMIHDALTTDPETRARSPFPNNRIPDSRIDPVMRTVRGWWPEPTSDARTRNHIFVPPRNQDLNRWDLRYDQSLDDQNNLYFRLSGQQTDNGRVPILPDSADGLYLHGKDVDITNRQMALVYNGVWSPNLVGSFRTGWSYIDTGVEHGNDVPVNPVIGLDMGNGLDISTPGSGSFTPAGFRGVGSCCFNYIGSQTRQFSADITWTRGRHTIKFGHTTFWLQSQIFNAGFITGRFVFDGRFSEDPVSRSGGESMADFLLGYSRELRNSNHRHMALRAPWMHQYVQDDWRVTDKLTINIGLRYEVSLPWVDKFDKISNLDVDTDTGQPSFVVVGERGDGRFNRALVTSDLNNLAPRLGFAYRWREGTVFRGGFGLFYANTMNTGGGEFMETNPPSHVKTQLGTDRVTPTIRVTDGPGPGALDPVNSPALVPGSFEIDPPWPVASQWNFNIQNQLPGNVLWEVGYFGTKGTHIIRRYNLNYAVPGPGTPLSRRIWPTVRFPGTDHDVGLDFLHNFRNNSNSNYHALQTKLEKRYGSGFSFLLSYTWSKAIGDYSFIPGEDRGIGANWGVQNALDLAAERSLLNQHVAHRAVVSYLYDLPFGRGQRFGTGWSKAMDAVLGGWTIGGINSFITGFPMNLSVRGNPSGTGGFNLDRPNVVGEWRLPRAQRGPDRWFNTDAFARNDLYTFGNAGRNILEAPGTIKFDLALHKNFHIKEGMRVQFRAEAFNAFNSPIFDGPNLQVGNRNLGVISRAAPGRVMQMGFKFIF